MASAAFTCIACRVAFADAELQRSHYKSDWHRYNLKRKVTNLPHVSAEAFNQRVLAQRAKVALEETKETSFYCEPCGKKISSKSAFENHNNSAKHKQKVMKLEQVKEKITADNDQMELNQSEEPEATGKCTAEEPEAMEESEMNEEEEAWDEDEIGLEECLFCSKISNSLESNIKHMTTCHSFFIPDLEYMVDLEDFITYLGQKVAKGKMCLWCNDSSKVFRSIKAAQQHMTDKGHCMIRFDGDSFCEYADFFDYTKSYPDGGNAEEAASVDVLETDEELQLTLPSGAKVGHRALSLYYKQNIVNKTSRGDQSVLKKISSHYKALGWTGATGLEVEKRIKDLQYMQRGKKKYWQKLGLKANKTSQPHFRYQYMF